MNLVNHRAQGPARLTLNGKFMGSGDTNVTGTFLASGAGPEFNTNISDREHRPDLAESIAARLWSV